MTDAQLLQLYQDVWRDSGGDELVVARALFEAGRLTRRRRRVPLAAPTREERRAALHRASAAFLLRRWNHLLEQVAVDHRTSVSKMLAGVQPGRPTPPAVLDACRVLRDKTDLRLEQIAGMVGVSFPTVWRATHTASSKTDRRLAA